MDSTFLLRRDHLPALSELQYLQTLVSSVRSDFFFFFGPPWHMGFLGWGLNPCPCHCRDTVAPLQEQWEQPCPTFLIVLGEAVNLVPATSFGKFLNYGEAPLVFAGTSHWVLENGFWNFHSSDVVVYPWG